MHAVRCVWQITVSSRDGLRVGGPASRVSADDMGPSGMMEPTTRTMVCF